MGFRRTFKDKLKLVKKAGLPVTKASVQLLNSVSHKNLKRHKL